MPSFASPNEKTHGLAQGNAGLHIVGENHFSGMTRRKKRNISAF